LARFAIGGKGIPASLQLNEGDHGMGIGTERSISFLVSLFALRGFLFCGCLTFLTRSVTTRLKMK
jgi:hypothetical protein